MLALLPSVQPDFRYFSLLVTAQMHYVRFYRPAAWEFRIVALRWRR